MDSQESHRTGSRKALAVGVLCSLLVVTPLGGCATSSASYYEKRGSFSNATLCRTYQSAQKEGNASFATDVRSDLSTQFGTDIHNCDSIIKAQNQKIAGVIVAVAAVAAVAAAAANSGGGGSGYTASDYQWDWDLFYNQYGQLVAACRGIQTGQFADNYRCAGLTQDDNRWPAK